MRSGIVVGLLLALAWPLVVRPVAQTPEQVKVELVGDNTNSIAAVTLHDTPEADSIVVLVFYWTTVPGFASPLLLSKTSVQPAYKDVAISSDAIPAPTAKIKSVTVTLVKNVLTKRFEYKSAP